MKNKRISRKLNADENGACKAFLEAYQYAKEKNLPLGSTICSRTGLSVAAAEQVHYKLLMSGSIKPEKIDFISLEDLTVNEKGGISISSGRLKSLGLTTYFPQDALLSATADGDRLIIQSEKDAEGKIKLKKKAKREKEASPVEQSSEVSEGSTSQDTEIANNLSTAIMVYENQDVSERVA